MYYIITRPFVIGTMYRLLDDTNGNVWRSHKLSAILDDTAVWGTTPHKTPGDVIAASMQTNRCTYEEHTVYGPVEHISDFIDKYPELFL